MEISCADPAVFSLGMLDVNNFCVHHAGTNIISKLRRNGDIYDLINYMVHESIFDTSNVKFPLSCTM